MRIATSSSPVATMAGSMAKHWLLGVAGGVNCLATSLRHPYIDPSWGITITDASGRLAAEVHRRRAAASPSTEPSGRYGADHAPSPRTDHQRRPKRGADTIPT